MEKLEAQKEIREEIEEESLKGKYLTFIVCEETYGIQIRYVTEIVGIQTITEMPEMPEYIKGVINLRGKIIPVMDVRLRFGMQEHVYDDRTCIVVIDYNEITYGLIVDSVSEVIAIGEDSITETPNLYAESSGFVKNIGKIDAVVILLLDCERLLMERTASILR
ncbi:purine-binding chemotaxis protein CheW [Sporobacter termitidis DSM 10068]|uniref:Chemotaxis protein CheW n=1 Tax=Sporobacter termitidis DSM 10068 TaxID=1123282 RepID=A0A1M5Y321_9FIRM|nr:chemotaxis protein CheW [Sporobacter termitidis]SHI06495.1 purine-binding chemotaxis protein CheW [Sporobacter termitidis DSM 10068]